MEAAASGKLFGYGVWRAPVLIDGLPAIWAVDSFGVVRKVRKLRPGDDEEVLGDRLWTWLLEHHPERRKLALVREGSAPPSATPCTPTGIAITPELLADLAKDPRSPTAKRAYLRRLASNAAQRAGRFRLRRVD